MATSASDRRAARSPPGTATEPYEEHNFRNDSVHDVAVTLVHSVHTRAHQAVLYTRRYAMLAMFASLGFLQCAVWNTWGPIASSVVLAYPGLNSGTIATLALWGPVTCIIGTVFCSILIQKKGLRFAMILSTLLMALGTSVRCVTDDEEYFLVSAHVGAILNGFAGVVVGIAPALVSTVWFPISFRTTATGIGCTFNQLGNAGGFFLGPYLVSPPDAAAVEHRREVMAAEVRLLNAIKRWHSRHSDDLSGGNGSVHHSSSDWLVGAGSSGAREEQALYNAFITTSKPGSNASPEYSEANRNGFVDYNINGVPRTLMEFKSPINNSENFNLPAPDQLRTFDGILQYLDSSHDSAGSSHHLDIASVSDYAARHRSDLVKLIRAEDGSSLRQQGLLSDLLLVVGKGSSNTSVSPQVVAYIKHSIQNYMYIVAGISVALFILVVAFFEDAPPTPPIAPQVLRSLSRSSSRRRPTMLSYARGSPNTSPYVQPGPSTNLPQDGRGAVLPEDDVPRGESVSSNYQVATTAIMESEGSQLHLLSEEQPAFVASVVSEGHHRALVDVFRLAAIPLRNGSFLRLLLSYSVTLGVNVAWSSVLEINLRPLGVSQHTASWIGVYITFGGVLLALFMARLSDFLFGQLKLSIMGLLLLATACFLWFLMIAVGCMPFQDWQLIASTSLAGSLNYAVSPLYVELFMELGYPTPEDVLGSVITLAWNCAGVIFLFFMEVQSDGQSSMSLLWLDYLLVCQGALAVLLLLCVKEEYRRSGPVKKEETRQTLRERRRQESEELLGDAGYYVSDDDSDEEEEQILGAAGAGDAERAGVDDERGGGSEAVTLLVSSSSSSSDDDKGKESGGVAH